MFNANGDGLVPSILQELIYYNSESLIGNSVLTRAFFYISEWLLINDAYLFLKKPKSLFLSYKTTWSGIDFFTGIFSRSRDKFAESSQNKSENLHPKRSNIDFSKNTL